MVRTISRATVQVDDVLAASPGFVIGHRFWSVFPKSYGVLSFGRALFHVLAVVIVVCK